MKQRPLYTVNYDLTNCDEEPLHLIRSVQQPAMLVVLDAVTLAVVAVSANAEVFWKDGVENLIGQQLEAFLPPTLTERLHDALKHDEVETLNPLAAPELRLERFPHGANVMLHRHHNLIYVEFEPMEKLISDSNFLYRVDKALQTVQSIQDEKALFAAVVREIRDLTQFDRVMLYRFDAEYNGDVIGEARREDLPPYLNLRYPHTDIPRQARELYFLNRKRQITSTRENEQTSIIYHPAIDQLDLTYVDNRGASPIHLEYLRNIGVGASLSIAIIVDQRLWGLIACHHQTPRLVDYRLRTMLSFMVKVMAGHLALWQSTDFRKQVLQTSIIRSRLFERMNEEYDIIKGLTESEADLLQLTEASGAVLLLDQEQYHLGDTPHPDEVLELAEWLLQKESSFTASHRLFEDFPRAAAFRTPPAGLLSIRLTDNPGEFVMWFRPEIVTTIDWGGQPDARKQITDGRVRLHPEMSFQKYTESIRGLARKWEQHHRDAAVTLRSDIKEVILQKYKEVTRLNGQLTNAYEELESFSYTVSHDLRAPLRNVKGFAEILQEDYSDALDEYGQSALNTIISSIGKMNQFINDILSFSRLGRTNLAVDLIDLESLLTDLWEEITGDNEDQAVLRLNLKAESMYGDHTQVRQVFLNLLSNSMKYASKERPPLISIDSEQNSEWVTIKVKDNGIGFSMKYADRIFAVFSRLVSDDQYPGTGVGLAITKRVLDKHRGTISVLSAPDEGACFTLQFPTSLKEEALV